MARIRLTRKDAAVEASRLAMEFVASLPEHSSARLVRVYPDGFVAKSPSSKHPLAWVAVFQPRHPPEEVVDGGELVVAVDLEGKTASVRTI